MAISIISLHRLAQPFLQLHNGWVKLLGWGMDVRSSSLHKEGKCDHIFLEELVPMLMMIRISLREKQV